MTGKVIIVTVLILLAISFSLLFVTEARNHDPDYKKSWSAVYFANPSDNTDLDFTLENHQGEKTVYGYEIFVNEKSVASGNTEIDPGAKQEISPVLGGIDLEHLEGPTKISVEVNAGNLKYKIYKNVK